MKISKLGGNREPDNSFPAARNYSHLRWHYNFGNFNSNDILSNKKVSKITNTQHIPAAATTLQVDSALKHVLRTGGLNRNIYQFPRTFKNITKVEPLN